MVKHPLTETKKVAVSENRQITIPKRFYEKLEMSHQVICELREGELVLRPVPKQREFSEEILKDLIVEGYKE